MLVAAVYAFFALTPQIRIRIRDLVLSTVVMIIPIAGLPAVDRLRGAVGHGQGLLVWQLFRRSNHEWSFFPTVVPPAIGPLVLLAAFAGPGSCGARSGPGGRRLLMAWIAVPCVVFQLWPVKGFQYLLPIAPAIAILAGRASASGPRPGLRVGRILCRSTAFAWWRSSW